MDKVTIIIPTYNSSSTINRCIDSILSQTYKNIEIVVVDDGSNDETLSICSLYAKKHKQIRVISNKHCGVSKARNTGIESSRGNYLLFVDSDDYIDKSFVKELVESSSSLNLAISDINIGDSKCVNFSRESFVKMIVSGEAQGFCVGMLFKNKLVRFPKDTGYMEDAVYLIRQLNSVKTIKVIKAKYHREDNEKSITRSSGYNSITNNLISMHISINKLKKEVPQYTKALTRKEYKITESLLAKVTDKETLKKILNNQTIHEQLKRHRNISFPYKIPITLAVRKNTSLLLGYIKIRNRIKRILSWSKTKLDCQ